MAILVPPAAPPPHRCMCPESGTYATASREADEHTIPKTLRFFKDDVGHRPGVTWAMKKPGDVKGESLLS